MHKLLRIQIRNIKRASKVCIKESKRWGVEYVSPEVVKGAFGAIITDPPDDGEAIEVVLAYNNLIRTIIKSIETETRKRDAKGMPINEFRMIIGTVIDAMKDGYEGK